MNPFLFNAQQFDQASGDYYLRARYYDQSNGRFISQDPFGGNGEDPITLHRYLYAGSDPVNIIDPSGRDGELVGLAVSMSIVGGLAGAYLVHYAGGNTVESLEGALAGAASGLALVLGYANEKGVETLTSGAFGGAISLAVTALIQAVDHPGQPLDPVKASLSFLKGFATSASSTATGFKSRLDKAYATFVITAGADSIDIIRKDLEPGGNFNDLTNQFLYVSLDAFISGCVSYVKKDYELNSMSNDDKKVFDVLAKLTVFQCKKILLDGFTKLLQAPIKYDIKTFSRNYVDPNIN